MVVGLVLLIEALTLAADTDGIMGYADRVGTSNSGSAAKLEARKTDYRPNPSLEPFLLGPQFG